jgi:hypothetical protein
MADNRLRTPLLSRPGCRTFGELKRKPEFAAGTERAAQAYPSAHCHHNVQRDRQPKAGARSMLPGRTTAQRLEDRCVLSLGDARAIVGNGEANRNQVVAALPSG